jgi:hypothetical protein
VRPPAPLAVAAPLVVKYRRRVADGRSMRAREMTRPRHAVAARGRRPGLGLGLGLLALLALLCVPACAAAHAPAHVAPLRPARALRSGSSPFKLARSAAHGVAVRRGAARPRSALGFAASLAEPCATACSGPLLYHEGGVVMRHVKVYLIQWEPPKPTENGQSGTSFEPLPAGYLSEVETYVKDVAAASGTLGNVFSVDTLYGASGLAGEYHSEFGGAFKDKDPYPARDLATCPLPSAEAPALPPENQPCISDAEGPSKENNFQLIAETAKFIEANPALATELEGLYVMLVPHGVNSCAGFEGAVAACNTNFYCAYHSAFGFTRSGKEHIAVYANMPYDAVPGCEIPDQPHGSAADSEIDTLSHEDNEAVTDPLGDAWFDIGGNEVADKCTYPFFDPLIDFNAAADAYGPLLGGVPGEFEEAGEELLLRKPGTGYNQVIAGGHFLTQREWSDVAGGCVAQAPEPTASFAAYSSPAVVGSAVSFNGAASSPTAGTLADYHWAFGDGQSASGAEASQVTHAYAAPGRYTVTLTVTNDSGASAETSQVLAVEEASPAGTTTVTVPGPTTTVTTPGPTTTVTTPGPTTTVTTPAPSPSATMHRCPSSSQHASGACRHTRRPAATPTRRRRCGSRATSRRGRRCPRSAKRSSGRSRR